MYLFLYGFRVSVQFRKSLLIQNRNIVFCVVQYFISLFFDFNSSLIRIFNLQREVVDLLSCICQWLKETLCSQWYRYQIQTFTCPWDCEWVLCWLCVPGAGSGTIPVTAVGEQVQVAEGSGWSSLGSSSGHTAGCRAWALGSGPCAAVTSSVGGGCFVSVLRLVRFLCCVFMMFHMATVVFL